MDNNVLAVIGVGEAAKPILKKAKELGVKTIGFGGADSISKDEASVFIEADIFNLEILYQYSKFYNVNGVIATSEITTEITAQLAEMLNLPGNSIKTGFYGRNKYLMRKKISELSTVYQPNYFLYENQEVSFPIMVKAVDSCGKKGIYYVTNQAEFIKAVDLCKNISTNSTVLIEEIIPNGDEFSVECLANGDEIQIVQITYKETSGVPLFVEISHHQPAVISPKLRALIEQSSTNILRKLGIRCGMAHLEIRIVEEKIFFIEVGARGGGDHIADTLTLLSTNFDYYKAAIECSFGIYESAPIKNNSYSGIYFNCHGNKHLKPLFEAAFNSDWCIENTVTKLNFPHVDGNVESAAAGYFIYHADQKIDINSVLPIEKRHPIRINDYFNAFDLLWRHNKEIGRLISDNELKDGINKFINKSEILAILDNHRIVACLILYCNNFETYEAYICNVYVLEQFRRLGLAKKILDSAKKIVKEKGFNLIRLHVDENNYSAIELYKNQGFILGKEINEKGQYEMLFHIV
ncbi:TPA: GNAT family N-acetyltransferase [Streptococcus suis]